MFRIKWDDLKNTLSFGTTSELCHSVIHGYGSEYCTLKYIPLNFSDDHYLSASDATDLVTLSIFVRHKLVYTISSIWTMSHHFSCSD